MENDNFIIHIPEFKVQYDVNANYSYTRKKGKEKLENCIPNIGISCVICNTRYKKVGEKNRRPSQAVIQEFSTGECSTNCVNACQKYERIKEEYLTSESAHIILQPIGVRGKDTGNKLLIQYDVLKAEFEPSNQLQYSVGEKQFIKDHINRFHLNTKEDKTRQLVRFVEDIINNNGFRSNIEYNNWIVELFVTQILENKAKDDVLKLCQLIYKISIVKFIT
ncbi:MAG: hypothetical protein Q4B70_14130 [Lachnospiraceae bacterium]|nr:hypothetical protein [Lachnospiraceae bacterium]